MKRNTDKNADQKEVRRVVLVGTYRGDQLKDWPGWYCWPLGKEDFNAETQSRGEKKQTDLLTPNGVREDVSRVSGEQIRLLKQITELWLFQGTREQRNYRAEFVGVKPREELIRDYGYPAKGKAHGDRYALFKTQFQYRYKNTPQEEADAVIIRTKDFAKRSPKIAKQLKAYLESPDRSDPDLAKRLPVILTKLRPEQLRVCQTALQLDLFAWNVAVVPIADKSVRSDTPTGLTSAEVLRHLKISRRNLDKCIEKGWLVTSSDGDSITESSMMAFQQTVEYDAMLNGSVDERNSLNDLTGKEWIPATKSYMFQKGLGSSHPHAKIEIQHPAPFSFQDIEALVEFFTKKGMSVLDPFGGVGSTAKACALLGRHCTSIELSEKYHNLS